ncbi:MAG: hypothetical protein ACXVYM_08925 [Gaiellaceae bacterium]
MALEKKQEKDEKSERTPKGYKVRSPSREQLLAGKKPPKPER